VIPITVHDFKTQTRSESFRLSGYFDWSLVFISNTFYFMWALTGDLQGIRPAIKSLSFQTGTQVVGELL
jgi:hypothetical protein